MYTEDELYADLTGGVKQAGQAVKKAIDIAKYIDNLTKQEATSLLSGSDASFVFTGQSTDLRYFSRFNEMPISMIENIPDETLKNAVIDEFNKAVLSGKINISRQTGKITITNDEDLKMFLDSNINKINLDISQNSKIYKDNLNKLQEQNLKDKQTLEQLLKKQGELKKLKEIKIIPLKEELKSIESEIFKLFQRKRTNILK